jgi:hypothetical protein
MFCQQAKRPSPGLENFRATARKLLWPTRRFTPIPFQASEAEAGRMTFQQKSTAGRFPIGLQISQ